MMQFRDLKAQYQALKTEIDAGMADVLASGQFILGKQVTELERVAAMTREECARKERDDLLNKVYGGAAGDLIAAFLKDSALSPEEAQRLRSLLDSMEV